jgi:histidinol-phosphate/aromatic aminotransferase/cobyric acid decarboxylase-like protein
MMQQAEKRECGYDTKMPTKVSPKLSPLAKLKAESSAWDATAWDLNTQQPHGGQEWSSLSNFCEDFSVTTNFMGPPWMAISAATAALQHLHHYPAANFEPAITDLAKFLAPQNSADIRKRLLLGNGASELIDLVTRVGAHQGSFFVQDTQYKEYCRAALAHGRERLEELGEADSDCALIAIVNPCNPTGEYRKVQEMKAYVEEMCTDHTTVLIDESMQPWVGPHWREDSIVNERAWVQHMLEKRDIRVYVIHSWTKIWTCPGLRLGSIVAPTEEDIATLKEHQVPWSLNVSALGFLSAAVKDLDFMEQTWELTPRWRLATVEKLRAMFPSWEFQGDPSLSWIWIDTKCAETAQKAVELAKKAGVPIRWGFLGYKKPQHVRIAVRSPHKQVVLFKALEPLAQKN